MWNDLVKTVQQCDIDIKCSLTVVYRPCWSWYRKYPNTSGIHKSPGDINISGIHKYPGDINISGIHKSPGDNLSVEGISY